MNIDYSSHPDLPPPNANKEILANRYHLIEVIGKGGMGEVYLAYDSVCGRRIALKRIRPDLTDHSQIRHRFLKEAHVTCQLTHPAIIPIYSIQASPLSAYYTMPYVEGDTLKQILRKTRQQERRGEKIDHLGGSIPALMRIFITICQAVAYAHSRGVLHRDLKPENMIVGKYGEVLILDWGLAKFIDSPLSDEEEFSFLPTISPPSHPEITRLGKVVGTVAYMDPQRALGHAASIQTDIYSLGVILYQLLTLKQPFKRGTLEEFRISMAKEEWTDPVIAAPYRDVPRALARITEKCLDSDLTERYQSVDQMIHDLENYLEGRSDWFHVADLDVKAKIDWEFQEHILIAEPSAITRVTEEAEWVNFMISKQSFTGNIRIETSVCLKEEGRGVGILMSVPEIGDRNYITDGYCLWLSSDKYRTTKLLRSNVEVMQVPDIFLKRGHWTRIRIEKIEKTIHLYLDDVLQFSYIAHLPLIGTHIGFLSGDADFEIHHLQVSVGSLNLTINCLAVPDAFLAHRDYPQALSEYRRIAYSFPDRPEGREALFRAGVTFIEQAKGESDKSALLENALAEFEKLHGTPGGPLEYLGKALVYQNLNENEEELKCFEIAYRRYPKHPLLPVLQEQIFSRMHEVSRQQRMAAYRFILLSVRHLDASAIDTHTRRLFSSLQKHWEPLSFIEDHTFKTTLPHHLLRFAIPLAFWLAKPYILGEIIDDLVQLEIPPFSDLLDAFAAIIELGSWQYARDKIDEIKSRFSSKYQISFDDIEMMIASHHQDLDSLFAAAFTNPYFKLDFSKMRTFLYLMDQALDAGKTGLIHFAFQALEHCELSFEARLRLNIRKIWALLLDKNWKQVHEWLGAYPIEFLNKESTLLHFLYGCWLQGTEGHEMALIHFTGVFSTTYPRTWTLGSHALANDLLEKDWISKSFLWERRQLYRQLFLYYSCAGDEQKQHLYRNLYHECTIL